MTIIDAHVLVAVTPELKRHPLWEGSILQLTFNNGGLTRRDIADYVTMKERAIANGPHTQREITFVCEIREAIRLDIAFWNENWLIED